jgi:hypothetical protein
MAWSAEALRRLLVSHDAPINTQAQRAAPWHKTVMSPKQTPQYVPESWCRPGFDPAVLMTPPVLDVEFISEPSFGSCTQAMALEDDMWLLDTVSETARA